jgi:hypothetical protein
LKPLRKAQICRYKKSDYRDWFFVGMDAFYDTGIEVLRVLLTGIVLEI